MDFYKPKDCKVISMEENNRHGIIYDFYNVRDNINSSVFWGVSHNMIYEPKIISTYKNYLKNVYPYYCEKLCIK